MPCLISLACYTHELFVFLYPWRFNVVIFELYIIRLNSNDLHMQYNKYIYYLYYYRDNKDFVRSGRHGSNI